MKSLMHIVSASELADGMILKSSPNRNLVRIVAVRIQNEHKRHILKRLAIACSVLILTIWLCCRPRQIGPGMDLSGEYVAQIQTTSAGFDKPFLPDSLMWDHAHVTITQSGAMHITCVSRTDSGLAVTNAIVVRGRPWNWADNGLEYKSTRIGPGFGFGVFPGVLKCKIRCRVSVVPSNGSLRESLCVKTDNQVSGFTLPFGFWSDPVNYSEVILTSIGTKDQVDDANFPTARDGYAQHPSPPSPPQSTHSSVVDIKPVSPKATSVAEADHFVVSSAIAAICGADPATADRYDIDQSRSSRGARRRAEARCAKFVFANRIGSLVCFYRQRTQ